MRGEFGTLLPIQAIEVARPGVRDGVAGVLRRHDGAGRDARRADDDGDGHAAFSARSGAVARDASAVLRWSAAPMPTPGIPARERFQVAINALQQGDAPRAAVELRAYLAEVPNSTPARNLLAQIETPHRDALSGGKLQRTTSAERDALLACRHLSGRRARVLRPGALQRHREPLARRARADDPYTEDSGDACRSGESGQHGRHAGEPRPMPMPARCLRCRRRRGCTAAPAARGGVGASAAGEARAAARSVDIDPRECRGGPFRCRHQGCGNSAGDAQWRAGHCARLRIRGQRESDPDNERDRSGRAGVPRRPALSRNREPARRCDRAAGARGDALADGQPGGRPCSPPRRRASATAITAMASRRFSARIWMAPSLRGTERLPSIPTTGTRS